MAWDSGIPCERAVREPPLRRVVFALRRGGMVELGGFEPPTSSLRTMRSPN